MTNRQLLSFAENAASYKITATFEGPWSGHFNHIVSPHANCAQKESFQAPTDLNSCIFSVGVILTSKPKWDFCVKSYSLQLVSWRITNIVSVRMCVMQLLMQLRCNGTETHYFKWIQSEFREIEQFNLSSLVYGLKKSSLLEILCLKVMLQLRDDSQRRF